MKAIILAAGRGSRMKSLTDDRPKCLVEFRGKPLLQWQLDALNQAGISEIALVTGYRSDLLSSYGSKSFENRRWNETQMVASLTCASEWLCEGPCIVSYSDIFYSADSVQRLVEPQAHIAVAYDPNWLALWKRRFDNPLDDAESFRIDAQARITEIGKKAKTVEEIQGQYMGLLHFTPTGWGQFQTVYGELDMGRQDKIDMTSMLQELIAKDVRLQGVPIASEWGECDSDDDIARLS